MATTEILPQERLNQVARQIGESLVTEPASNRFAAELGEARGPRIHESFRLHTLSDSILEMSSSKIAPDVVLSDQLLPSEQWHHQIQVDHSGNNSAGNAIGFARSAEEGENQILLQLNTALLAERINNAVLVIEAAEAKGEIPADCQVRLFTELSRHIYAFHLACESVGKEYCLIAFAPSQYMGTDFSETVLYSPAEFLQRLLNVPEIGTIPQAR